MVGAFKALCIEAACAEADARIDAAELRDQVRREEADTALEREWDLGRVGSLEETPAKVRSGPDTTRRCAR